MLLGGWKWARQVGNLPAVDRIALLDLSLPYLRRMTVPEARDFIALTERVIMADGRVTPFEFMVQKLIARQVGVALGLRLLPRVRLFGMGNAVQEVASVLHTFAGFAGDPASVVEAAEEFRLHTGLPLPEEQPGGFNPEEMTRALAKIEELPQLAKKQMLRMCGLIVMHDGKLQDREMELLRATAEAIGAPVPPFAIPSSRAAE